MEKLVNMQKHSTFGANYLRAKNQTSPKTNFKTSFKSWLKDEDKICTDGLDDGKLSFKESATSFGKGLLCLVKSTINKPLKTIASIGIGAGITALTGGALLPVMVTAGSVLGAINIAKGVVKVKKSKTDKEAKEAFESIGKGTFVAATSILGTKGALKNAAHSGVEGATISNNPIENLATCVKIIPNSITTSLKNIKGNFLTLTTGKLHANCNELRRNTMPYKSKPTTAKAYRFNPNGTPEEIIKNNPGVFQGKDGHFYVKNKWDANSPFRIDTSREQMIMQYAPDDMAVCDGEIFAGSYVDSKAFEATQALDYQNPTDLEYGKLIDVTKQAFGRFKMAELGTKVQTLEGVNEIDPGEIISIDHTGSPYVVMMAKQSQRVDFIPKAS